MPGAEFPVEVSRFGRGLNLVDAPDLMREGEARILQNWRIRGAGRITPRSAVRALNSTSDIEVLGIWPWTYQQDRAAVAVTRKTTTGACGIRVLDLYGDIAATVSLASPWSSGVAAGARITAAIMYGVVFIVDEAKSLGLVVWDPDDNLGSGSASFQPTFDFDLSGGGHAALDARFIVEHMNHLWAFGYGDETDPDRPEIGRFSYLGLVDDGEGAGDAGVGGATGSTNLFDAEDAVPLATRGEPVVGASSAPGRLVVCTPRRAGVIYGSDRTSWQYRQIDANRGLVATRAIVDADGVAYWMSPRGPCRYAGGGQVEDLSRKVLPRVGAMDTETMFAVESPGQHQIRFYYKRVDDESASFPNRFIAWDTENDVWLEDTCPEVVSGGLMRITNVSSPPGPDGSQDGPIAHVDITRHTATMECPMDDTWPGTVHEVYLAPDVSGSPGTYVLVHTLPASQSRYTHYDLDAGTTYWTKVRTLRNGQELFTATVEGSFTTLAAGTVAVPADFAVADSPFTVEVAFQRSTYPSVFVEWRMIETDVRVLIERKTGAGGSYAVVHETEWNASGWRDRDVAAGQEYFYRVRAEDEDGNLSSYTSELSATPTTDPLNNPDLPVSFPEDSEWTR